MRRLGHVAPACGCADLITAAALSRSSLLQQRATLKNLHQYPTARHKSLVKDRRRFARNWWLMAGNNYELVEEKGHEREATENFSVYQKDATRDRYVLSTNRLADLPPRERLSTLVGIMRERWKVRDADRGYDKAKLLLQAIECFSEMRLSDQIEPFDQLPLEDQNTFLQYVHACTVFAQRCSHSHPDAVMIVLRAAQICDEMRCVEKRDELIRMTELCNERSLGTSAVTPPVGPGRSPPLSLDVQEYRLRRKTTRDVEERYPGRPDLVAKPQRTEYMPVHQFKKVFLTDMRRDDPILRLSQSPSRPEFSSS